MSVPSVWPLAAVTTMDLDSSCSVLTRWVRHSVSSLIPFPAVKLAKNFMARALKVTGSLRAVRYSRTFMETPASSFLPTPPKTMWKERSISVIYARPNSKSSGIMVRSSRLEREFNIANFTTWSGLDESQPCVAGVARFIRVRLWLSYQFFHHLPAASVRIIGPDNFCKPFSRSTHLSRAAFCSGEKVGSA